MRIAGFEPLTLIDYPGKLAAIVFTPGCVLRCPFCHNPELIEAREKKSPFFHVSHENEFFTLLENRRGKLDGVVITGGEPTLHADLLDFVRHVKDMGFLVKLDSNGVFPDIIEHIISTGLVDYWAMDIKHAPDKYHLASGRTNIPLTNFQRSVRLIMDSGVPYEFRTTVVPGIHEEADFDAIGEWIHGAPSYYLQAFRDIKIYDPSLAETVRKHPYLDLDRIQTRLQKHIKHVGIRN